MTTSLYASMATGGGRRVRGNNSNWLAIDNNSGRPYEDTKLTAGGLLDYDAVLAANASNPNGSQAIFTNAVNDHDWYGVLSSYKTASRRNLRLQADSTDAIIKAITKKSLTICWVVHIICRVVSIWIMNLLM